MGAQASCGQPKATADLSDEPPLVLPCGDEPIGRNTSSQQDFANAPSDIIEAKETNLIETQEDIDEVFDNHHAKLSSAKDADLIKTKEGVHEISEMEKKPKRGKMLPKSQGKRSTSAADTAPLRQANIERTTREAQLELHANDDRPFVGLLKAARPPPDALAAASWIGSCSQNALKADPQLASSTSSNSECQCSARLSSRPQDTIGASPGQKASIEKKSPHGQKASQQFTKHQLEQIKKQEPKMVERAAKLEHIGKNLDDCNQQ